MQDLVKFVGTEGYAILADVLPQDEIAILAAELSDPNLTRSRAGIRHAMKHPAVANVAGDSRLLGPARAVLGETALPYRATLFDKSSNANWLVVWHQDKSLPLQARADRLDWGPWSVKEGILYAHAPTRVLTQILALRVHLDDSTHENGPLRILPRTHSKGVLAEDAIHNLVQNTIPVECTVPRGGVLAMRPLIVHASSKSETNKPRRVLHIEYAAAPIVDGFRLAIA